MDGFIAGLNSIGADLANSRGTRITSGLANTKGSYGQLIAATERKTDWLLLAYEEAPTVGTPGGVDIAIGAGGSEQVILANLGYGWRAGRAGLHTIIPLSLPAGVRVAARWQSVTASDVIGVSAIAGAGNGLFPSFQVIDTYGFNTATSLGVLVDPGGTANTKGAYTEITSGTTRNHTALMFAIDNQNVNITTSAQILLDIAIGAAASETVVIPNFQMASSSTTTCFGPGFIGPIPIQIPAGTRLAARAQSTNNTVGTRKFGITAYGLS